MGHRHARVPPAPRQISRQKVLHMTMPPEPRAIGGLLAVEARRRLGGALRQQSPADVTVPLRGAHHQRGVAVPLVPALRVCATVQQALDHVRQAQPARVVKRRPPVRVAAVPCAVAQQVRRGGFQGLSRITVLSDDALQDVEEVLPQLHGAAVQGESAPRAVGNRPRAWPIQRAQPLPVRLVLQCISPPALGRHAGDVLPLRVVHADLHHQLLRQAGENRQHRVKGLPRCWGGVAALAPPRARPRQGGKFKRS
mmetsp:Transcript_86704/g.223308  ORF Transcript_86704/g.223308 Transcript_86704/m.223308 type:complete len:253 (+) Transcript_86704:112-870(+)